jgi:hypothetical protein
MKIELKQLSPYIHHVRFDTRHDMCSTLVRIAEYYESPFFHGKIFTLSQFKKWYMKSQKKKTFTYYKDWSGYNIPSKELKPFFDGRFNPLSKKEKQFLELFKNIKGKYYIIGTYRKDRAEQQAIDHEVSHAMFWMNRQYKSQVKAYIKDKDHKELADKIIKMGYANKVLIDEINAYLSADLPWLRKKKKLKGKQYSKYAKDLILIKKRHKKSLYN